jgi:hypothetical protein
MHSHYVLFFFPRHGSVLDMGFIYYIITELH